LKERTWEVEGIRQKRRLKMTWWDCVRNDMESLGLSQKNAKFRNKWRRRMKGQPANLGSPGKKTVKMECVIENRIYLQQNQQLYQNYPV